MLCGKSDDKEKVFQFVRRRFLTEPFPAHDWHADCRPIPLFPLIIRIWPSIGKTDKLCRLILAPADYSESPFSSVWARWMCFELNCSIRHAPFCFSSGTLRFIRRRCNEIRSHIPPNASVFPSSIKEEIARLLKAVDLAEINQMEDSIRMQESKPFPKQEVDIDKEFEDTQSDCSYEVFAPNRGYGIPYKGKTRASKTKLREEILRKHFRFPSEINDRAKVIAAFTELDKTAVPPPDKTVKTKKGKKRVRREGTWLNLLKNRTWRRGLEATLKRNLRDRSKIKKTKIAPENVPTEK